MFVQFLSTCTVGASLEDIEEEEEDAESIDSGILPPSKEGCYEIIGTLKDKANPKPEFVKEIIKVCINSTFFHLLVVSASEKAISFRHCSDFGKVKKNPLKCQPVYTE